MGKKKIPTDVRFAYDGYTFAPFRTFSEDETDDACIAAVRSTLWDLDCAAFSHGFHDRWSHDGFIAAADGAGCGGADLFYCIENSRIVVPGSNALFLWNRPEDISVATSLFGQGKTASQAAPPVYMVTTISEIEDSGLGFASIGESRCVGWFADFEDAKVAVLENNGDINEAGAYPYAVIETVTEGFYPDGLPRWWFAYDEMRGRYLPVGEPGGLKQLCGFSIG